MSSELLAKKKRKSRFAPCENPRNSIEEFRRQINEIFNNLFVDEVWFEFNENNVLAEYPEFCTINGVFGPNM